MKGKSNHITMYFGSLKEKLHINQCLCISLVCTLLCVVLIGNNTCGRNNRWKRSLQPSKTDIVPRQSYKAVFSKRIQWLGCSIFGMCSSETLNRINCTGDCSASSVFLVNNCAAVQNIWMILKEATCRNVEKKNKNQSSYYKIQAR